MEEVDILLRGFDRILTESGKASRLFVDDNDVWVHIYFDQGVSISHFCFCFCFAFAFVCVFALLFRELGNKCGWTLSASAFGVATGQLRVGGIFRSWFVLSVISTGPIPGSGFLILHGAVGRYFTLISMIEFACGYGYGYGWTDIWEGRQDKRMDG